MESKEVKQKFRDEIDMESCDGYDTSDEPNLQHLGKQCAIIHYRLMIEELNADYEQLKHLAVRGDISSGTKCYYINDKIAEYEKKIKELSDDKEKG